MCALSVNLRSHSCNAGGEVVEAEMWRKCELGKGEEVGVGGEHGGDWDVQGDDAVMIGEKGGVGTCQRDKQDSKVCCDQ